MQKDGKITKTNYDIFRCAIICLLNSNIYRHAFDTETHS